MASVGSVVRTGTNVFMVVWPRPPEARRPFEVLAGTRSTLDEDEREEDTVPPSWTDSHSRRYTRLADCQNCSPLHSSFLRREVVASLIEEYKACESPNYVNWGVGGGEASEGIIGDQGAQEEKL